MIEIAIVQTDKAEPTGMYVAKWEGRLDRLWMNEWTDLFGKEKKVRSGFIISSYNKNK